MDGVLQFIEKTPPLKPLGITGSGVMSGTAVNLEFFQKLGFGDANL